MSDLLNTSAVLVAPLKLEFRVKEELGSIRHLQVGQFFFVLEELDQVDFIWPQSIWRNVTSLNFESIKEASRALLQEHRGLWLSHSLQAHRRAQLIAQNLKTYKLKRIEFLQAEFPVVAEWMLVNENLILFSKEISSKSPMGYNEFVENKSSPPSRAYLKLWELFTFHLAPPKTFETVFDLGACPGGWTWVLKDLARKVIAVDKAPIAKDLMSHAKVNYMAKDAFQLRTEDLDEDINWFFSDIACYPERAYELVSYWWEKSNIHTFVCTVKLQKEIDKAILEKMKRLGKSRLIHLYQNKNELTWILERS